MSIFAAIRDSFTGRKTGAMRIFGVQPFFLRRGRGLVDGIYQTGDVVVVGLEIL